jgi:tRNA A37 N6-isopentenylltransferase MiaA
MNLCPKDFSLSTSVPFLAIIGPTCVGKSAYVHQLMRLYPLEVINMDSFQVYSHFKSGTGRADMPATGSHLYGFLDPTESLSIPEYLDLVEEAIKRIRNNGNITIFEGGSLSLLHALSSRYRLRIVGIRPFGPEWLEQRIAQRMNSRFEANLIHEITEGLQKGYRNTRILTDDVVYLPLVRYLDREITLEEARHQIQRNLLQMAFRQMVEYEGYQVEWLHPIPEVLGHLGRIVETLIVPTCASQE